MLHVGIFSVMLLTGEFPGTVRASRAGTWKASFTVSCPFSSGQPPQLTSCHPEERDKSASCAWVSLALPLTLFQGDRKSPLFQLFLEIQSPGTLPTSQINRTRQTLQDAMRTISHKGMAEDHASLHTFSSATGGCFYGTFFLCN